MSVEDHWGEAAEAFAALSAVNALLSRLYAAPPDLGMFAIMQDLDSEESTTLNSEDSDWTEGLGLLAGYCRQADLDKRLVDVIADHSQLFVGPGHVQAPPWGSVHIDVGFLHGPSSQKVAGAYRAAGLEPDRPDQEPPDHLAIELDFIAQLDKRISDALATGDVEEASQNLSALKDFVSNFLVPWVDSFSRLVEKHAETDFYRGLARITRSAVELQQSFASRLADELK